MNWRSLRTVSLSVAALAAAAAFVAGAAPMLGLGAGEAFFTYVWFGLPRRALFFLGLSACSGMLALAVIFWALEIGRARALSAVANLVLVVASVTACLLVLELGVRLANGIPIFAWRNFLAERNALLTTQTLNQYDPVLGWVLREDQRVSPANKDGSLSTGKYGVRLDSPDGAEPAKGAILVSGDSFTAGSEVGDRQSWPAHLEAILRQPVVNAATGAWGADQIVLRLEQLMPVLEPKIIVASFLDDDIMRAGFRVYGGANKSYFTVEQGALVHHDVPVPKYTGAVAETPGYLLLPSYSYLFQWTADRLGLSDWWRRVSVSYVRVDNDPVEVSCLLLARLKAVADKRGTRMIFLMQYPGSPKHDAIARQSHPRKVLECASAAGIQTIDLWDDLVAVYKGSYEEYKGLWASFDGTNFGHMSSAGNRLVAQKLAARLVEKPR